METVKLIVFSACESGKITADHTNKLLGFVRSVLTSGSPKILFTFWSVHDESTSQYIQLLYNKLFKDMIPLDKAYQESVLKIKEKHSYPFHWAPFVLYNT